jgi:RNA polymerase sigma factor (TIGR02999 family)
MDTSTTPTDALSELRPSSQESLNEVIALAYQELRTIAHHRLAVRERDARGTLSTTALVHEAYLKLSEQSHGAWRDHAHFLAVASLAMRHVIVDRARERSALKRGGTRRRITLDDVDLVADDQAEVVLQINDALERIATLEPRLTRVVECRFFGGLTEQETADALGLTHRTVQRDWVKARVLLRRALEP